MNKFGFVVLLAIVGTVVAEAPLRYRQNSRRLSARQEEAPAPYPAQGWKPSGARLELPSEVTTTDLPTTTTDVYEETTTDQGGPYQYSGWVPQGARLELPNNQPEPIEQPSEQEPSQVYGVPHQVYGPPAQEYGLPKDQEREGDDDVSGDGSETRSSSDNPDVEELDVNENGQENKDNQQNEPEQLEPLEPVDIGAIQSGQGTYFIQLADGSLQRVVYLPTDQYAQSAAQIAQPVKLINPIVVPQYVQYNAQYQTGW